MGTMTVCSHPRGVTRGYRDNVSPSSKSGLWAACLCPHLVGVTCGQLACVSLSSRGGSWAARLHVTTSQG